MKNQIVLIFAMQLLITVSTHTMNKSYDFISNEVMRIVQANGSILSLCKSKFINQDIEHVSVYRFHPNGDIDLTFGPDQFGVARVASGKSVQPVSIVDRIAVNFGIIVSFYVDGTFKSKTLTHDGKIS